MTFYSGLYNWFFFPIYESYLRNRNTLKYLKIAEENQWKSEEEIREFQWGELRKLLKHAYENVPFYRETFEKLKLTPDDIRSPEDFRLLPIIDRKIIRENRIRMIAENYRGRTLTKATGGSTGQPLRFDYTRDSYEWRRAMTLRGYRWAGYREGEKTAYLWSAPVGEEPTLSKLKKKLHHSILRQKYFNVFNMTPENMRLYLKEMIRYKPEHMISYGLQLYYFAKFIKENNLSVPDLESIIIGVEKVHDEEKEFIKSVFNCEVFETYGCREFMLIAAECEMHDGMHISADNLYVEILRDNEPVSPGEIGEVIITDLHNYGMPFIRYKIGDLAAPSDKKCPCGRGLPLIKSVEGRLLDVIVTPEGKILPGALFPHLMKEFEEVERYQVVLYREARRNYS